MSVLPRPRTPEYLRDAAFEVFGRLCLRCALDRPLKVAHLVDWPRCRAIASRPVGRIKAPDWYAEPRALALFHNLGNVVPLCSNCHELYDSPKEEDVDEAEIRGFRDAALRRSDVLRRALDYVVAELTARPGRCRHLVDGRRSHSHQVDLTGCMHPLSWIADGYAAGVLSDHPEIVVVSAGGSHHHVRLDRGELMGCGASLDDCARDADVRGRRLPQTVR